MPLARAGARLQGTLLTTPAARRDPRGNPLVRFPPPPGYVPARLAARLSTCGTSPGIPSPTALAAGGVYVACAGRNPTRPTTFRPQGSRPLDGLLLHLPRHAFPRGNAPGVPPSGVHSSRTGPPASAGRVPLMTFLPRPAHSRPSSVRTGGATPDDLGGFSGRRLSPPTGCCSVRESVPSRPTV